MQQKFAKTIELV